jgi:tryptophan synthase alpha chain
MMGYLNPALIYGIDSFCASCEQVGIDGVILPDLPFDVYVHDYKQTFNKHHLHNIFLVAPQSSDERIRQIDRESGGFLYVVSSSSVTGARGSIGQQQVAYFRRIVSLGLKNPFLIGFGISNRETFQQACCYAGGAIIGSAFIKALDNSTNLKATIADFVKLIN